MLGPGNVEMKYAKHSPCRRSQPREEDRQAVIVIMDENTYYIWKTQHTLQKLFPPRQNLLKQLVTWNWEIKGKATCKLASFPKTWTECRPRLNVNFEKENDLKLCQRVITSYYFYVISFTYPQRVQRTIKCAEVEFCCKYL